MLRSFTLVRNVLTGTFTCALLLGAQFHASAEELESPIESTTQADLILPSNKIEVEYFEELPKYYSDNVGTFNSVSALMPKVIEALQNFESTLTFTYTGDIKTFQSEFLAARNELFVTPGYDYIHGTVKSTGYSYSSVDGKTYSVTMNLKYFETKEHEEYVTKRIKEIAAQLTKPGMSELEKVLAVNDYVVSNTAYSFNSEATPHNAYALLKEGKAVCQAYALVTYRLLTEMGVEARYIVGYAGEAHAWNSVKIDGKWYHLDTTWDDPIFNGGDLGDSVSYKYFLVTTEQLKKDHSWTEAEYPVATDTRFSYFHDLVMGDKQGEEIYYVDAKKNYNVYKLNYRTGIKELVLARPVLHLVVFDDTLYYAASYNKSYLTAYNLETKTEQIIDSKAVSTLSIRDEVLHYKSGSQNLTYEIPLTEAKRTTRDVRLRLAALSELSPKEELDAVQALYNALTDEQKAEIKTIDRLTQLQQQYPANLAAAEAFAPIVASYTDNSNRKAMKELIAKYDALTPGKQVLVPNKDKVLAFKQKIAEQDEAIEAVMRMINNLSTKSKTYLQDVIAINTAYDALSEELRSDVTNFDKFEELAKGANSATDAFGLIEALDGKSAEAIVKARQAYTDTPKDAKKLVTNLKTLTAFEKSLKNEIAAWKAIDVIDPTSSKFLSQVKKAKTAYNKKGINTAYISNADEFLNLSAQADVFERISKLKTTSTKLIAEALSAKEAFDKLTDKTYVTNASKLSESLERIKPAQAVIATIAAISGDSAQVVIDARKAYDSLDKQSKKYVTNYKTLTTLEKRFKDVLNAIKLIDAIDVNNSKKFLTQVKAAKKAYDKTGSLKGSVTNGQTLEKILPQSEVYEKISKLKPTSAKYIAEVTTAKEAYDALSDKSYVTNAETLETAIEAIKPAQEVVVIIDELKGNSVQAIVDARTQFDNLDKNSKRYVTNQKRLKDLEKQLKAEIKAFKLEN